MDILYEKSKKGGGWVTGYNNTYNNTKNSELNNRRNLTCLFIPD